jgi:hypothetical protein
MTYFKDTRDGLAIADIANGAPALATDLIPISRGGTDFSLNLLQHSTFVRKTPAGSRTTALPAALTAADNDKVVVLTGTTGNLTVDGTVTDGFRCRVISTASGVATYSGITGLGGSASLAAGGTSEIAMVGATVYATAVTSSGSGATLATSGVPLMDGTAALGAASTAAPFDHVHPSDTTRVAVSNIPAGAGKLLGATASAGVATAITLGTGLSITSGTINATGGSGSGSVTTGSTGQLAYYSANGTTVGPATIGTGLALSGGTLSAAGSKAFLASWAAGAIVTAGTYALVDASPIAFTINNASYQVGTAGGSFSVAVRQGTPTAPTTVTGLSAVSVSSTTRATTTASGNNAVGIGDRVEIVISSVVGSPTGATVQLNVTQ